MDALTVITQVSQASSPFLLVLAVWAFATGRVVPRWIYDEERKRADEWQQFSKEQQAIAARSLSVAERERPA